MATFVLRRLLAAVLIVIGGSFIVYLLMANAGDPLAFTAEIRDPTAREAVRRSVTAALHLDVHPVARYFTWLADVVRGDFGISARTQQPVADELGGRLLMTLKLVTVATILSVVVGTIVGIVTAIRQYSGVDYVATFFTFVFFSLPVFWVAVILKGVGGINLNDWWRDGAPIRFWVGAVIAVVVGGLAGSLAGGTWRRRLAIGLAAFAVAALLVWYVAATDWLLDPFLGPLVILVASVGVAFGVTAVFAGVRNRRALGSALTTAGIGVIGSVALRPLFDSDRMNIWILIGLGVASIVVGAIVGIAWGGFDRGLSARVSGLVALLVGGLVFLDQSMRSWSDYATSSVIRNRPIKTIGDRESRLEGSFWVITNDTFSHLLLPTLALMLISLASYTRYSRASMLEVLNQDYIRTARAKGLTERTVMVRHGFRNAMIPLATIVAFDIGGILGGAVITETVFEWNAMGRMFQQGLLALDPNPVMAFFVVVALFAIVANLAADLLYAVLDPRIRIGE